MTDIAGATASTYTLVSADLGQNIAVKVTATNTAGSANATAAAVGPIAAGPFTPASLTGLIGWWDASITASLTLSGSDILAVADQSGGGNAMNWANAKPVYSATGFNSKPAFIFAPATVVGWLAASSFPMGTGNTLTAWFVGNHTATSVLQGRDGRALDYHGAGGNSSANWSVNWPTFGSPANTLVLYRYPVGINVAVTIPGNHRIIVTIDSSNNKTMYVDGVPTSGIFDPANWVSGGTMSLGGFSTNFDTWDGAIAEAGIATGYSDATTVGQLDTYLKTKWGLGGGWTPASLTGLIGWWDASITASMTITGGTDIQAMADQSGSGNNLGWVGFGRPQYNAVGFNGKPAFVLQGVGTYNAFGNTSFPLGTGNTLTLWWVGQIVSASSSVNNPGIISYEGAGQSTDYANASSFILCRAYNSTTQVTMYRITNAFINCPTDVNHRVIVTINSSGVQTFYIDGIAQAGATQVGNWTSPGTLNIGRSASGDHFAGPTGEVGIATGYSDATTVGQLDTYLKTKWGLGGTTHRYWRINMTSVAASAYSFAEIEFRTTAGVSLAFSGGTASAADTYSGSPGPYDASKAADGNAATIWSSNNNALPQWWMYDFGTSSTNWRDVKEIAMTSRNDFNWNQSPATFTPQWSDDGLSWTSKTAITATWTGATQTLTFAVT